jgi:release factor H-coupled RctB family protein
MDVAFQKITSKVSLIASKKTWIDDVAIQQLLKTSELKHMDSVAGMPDLHPGRGYPIGAAFFSYKQMYPALVGNDIGCGMSFWQTHTKISKININKWSKKLKTIESPLDDTWKAIIEERKQQKKITNHDFDHALGTIGGGNHFAEFQVINEIFDHKWVEASGLDKKQLQLLVYSGSRGLGHSILNEHLQQFNHNGLKNADDLHHYMQVHDEAIRWAELNRELIAQRFLLAIGSKGFPILDIHHNFVQSIVMNEKVGFLHRKGATPSDKGLVIIPGSRGDYKTALGSHVICGNKTLLYDEAPQAYKKCETIIEAMLNAALIELIAKFRPVLTFKTNGKAI